MRGTSIAEFQQFNSSFIFTLHLILAWRPGEVLHYEAPIGGVKKTFALHKIWVVKPGQDIQIQKLLKNPSPEVSKISKFALTHKLVVGVGAHGQPVR